MSRLVEPAAGPAALLRTGPRSRAVSLAEFSSADAIDGLLNSDQPVNLAGGTLRRLGSAEVHSPRIR